MVARFAGEERLPRSCGEYGLSPEAFSLMSYNVAQGKGKNMTANSVVRARVEESVKQEAAVVLAAMGLTVSDAFRMLLTRIAREKALPFEPLVPNAETIAAMKEARAGHLAQFDGVDALLADLNACQRRFKTDPPSVISPK